MCRRRMRQSFSRGLLGRTVAPVLVRRCAGRVDAKVAATLLEETVDVQRLGVGLDGDVLWAVRRCVRYDKCGNCPESETSVSIWMNIIGVAVCRQPF